jgi:hypothetical protein
MILITKLDSQDPNVARGELVSDGSCSNSSLISMHTLRRQTFESDGLHHWLLDTPYQPAPRFPLCAFLVEDKQRLGWNQLRFCRWSKLWATRQTSNVQRWSINPTSNHQGTGWSSRAIALIWNLFFKALIDRNQAFHGHTTQTKNVSRRNRPVPTSCHII